jgi:hypothetical protein
VPPYDSLYVSINLVTSPTGSTTSAEKRNNNNNNTEILSTDNITTKARSQQDQFNKNKMHQN